MNKEPYLKSRHPKYTPEPGELVGNKYIHKRQVSTTDDADPKSGQDTKRYASISRHYLVYPAITIHVNACFWTGWSIVADNDYKTYPQFEEIDKKIIQSVKKQASSLSNEDFSLVLKGMLYNSLVFGNCIAEKNFILLDGEIKLDEIKSHYPYEFTLYDDGYDNLREIQHTSTSTVIIEEDLEKFIVGVYPYLNDGNFYGRSIIHSVIKLVKILNILEESQAKASQLLAIRPIVYWYDGERSDVEIKATEEALFNLESGSVLSFEMSANPGKPSEPVKYEDISVLEDRASERGLEQIRYLIELYQRMIPRTLGIPDDIGLSSTNFGSFAKSSETMSLFMSSVISNQEYMERLINKDVIPDFIIYNYQHLPTGYRLPKFKFNLIEEDVLEKLSRSYIMLTQAGIVDPNEEFIRENLGIPKSTIEAKANKDVKPINGISQSHVDGTNEAIEKNTPLE